MQKKVAQQPIPIEMGPCFMCIDLRFYSGGDKKDAQMDSTEHGHLRFFVIGVRV